jgi:hypothetical protein
MFEVEHFLSLCEEKRRAHVVATARARLRTALRQRISRSDPLVLENGDQFLYWRSGPGAAQSGYKGPATCLGMHRALVISVQGGHFVTAHISRCLLHARSVYNAAPNPVVLPSRRDDTMKKLILRLFL